MRRPIFRGWFVVAACFLCMLLSGGIGWFTFPVFIPPLKEEFGWTDLQLGLAVGIWAGVGAVFSPVAGRLIDRFGSRWIMLAGAAGGGLATAALGEVRAIGHLYCVIFFVAIFVAAGTYVPVTSTISRWFVRRRGLAMSIAMAGMGLGGFLMPNLSSFLIQTVGWRWAYRIFGILICVVLLPVTARWIHGRPSDIGLAPDGDAAPEQEQGELPASGAQEDDDGFGAREAMGMSRFWLLGFADVANAIPVVSLSIYLVRFSIQRGIPDDLAAFAYSSMSAAAMVGMLAAGLAAGRWSKRIMITLGYGLPAASVLFLFGLDSAGPLFCFTLLAGFCAGSRSTLWPLVVGDCFGNRAYSSILGFLVLFYNAGAVVGPPVAGRISDATGSFYWVFVLSIAAFLISSLLVALGAKPSPPGSRLRVGEEPR
jgi:MFS family permease